MPIGGGSGSGVRSRGSSNYSTGSGGGRGSVGRDDSWTGGASNMTLTQKITLGNVNVPVRGGMGSSGRRKVGSKGVKKGGSGGKKAASRPEIVVTPARNAKSRSGSASESGGGSGKLPPGPPAYRPRPSMAALELSDEESDDMSDLSMDDVATDHHLRPTSWFDEVRSTKDVDEKSDISADGNGNGLFPGTSGAGNTGLFRSLEQRRGAYFDSGSGKSGSKGMKTKSAVRRGMASKGSVGSKADASSRVSGVNGVSAMDKKNPYLKLDFVSGVSGVKGVNKSKGRASPGSSNARHDRQGRLSAGSNSAFRGGSGSGGVKNRNRRVISVDAVEDMED